MNAPSTLSAADAHDLSAHEALPEAARAGVRSSLQALLDHFDHTVLPLWTGPGWNAAMALPFEALSADDARPLPAVRYRAMACARQLYVFSRAHVPSDFAGHADTLFASLRRWFADPRGGWYYSVDADGAPLDDGKDLYTHAFIVFACAAYWRHSGNPQARAVLDDTASCIENRFRIDGGLYHAALGPDFSPCGAGVLQNPVMHLTEAYLAAHDVSGDGWYGERLRDIGRRVQSTFVDANNGCVAELPQGMAGNRIEPGHQFEWYALLSMGASVFGDLRGASGYPPGQPGLAASLARACAFAQRHGVSPDHQGVAAALDADGNVIDATQRIWAQTEYARALALRGDAAGWRALGQWLAQFPGRFLHGLGWRECIGPDGAVLRADMPSTTPYHLATAYDALRRAVDDDSAAND